MPILKKVNKDFFKKWTSEMAYVVGFFMADGYITHNRRGASFFCFQICDRDILRKIKRILGSEHKISVRKRDDKNQSIQYRLQVGSKEMCKDLEYLGVVAGKTHNMRLPNAPTALFAHFVRGYFDGDGNVWTGKMHKERQIPTRAIICMFTSCSTTFLRSLHRNLKSIGIVGGSIYISKHNYSRLQLSTSDSLRLYDFMYNKHVLRDGLFLKRKKAIFEKYKSFRV